MLDQDVPLGDDLPARVEDRGPAHPVQLVSGVSQAGLDQLGGQDVVDVEEEQPVGPGQARPHVPRLGLGPGPPVVRRVHGQVEAGIELTAEAFQRRIAAVVDQDQLAIRRDHPLEVEQLAPDHLVRVEGRHDQAQPRRRVAVAPSGGSGAGWPPG